MRLPITQLSEQEVLNTVIHETKDAIVTTESDEQYTTYACKTITVPAATTNYNVKTANPTLFVVPYKLVAVYAKDAPCTIRLYSNTEDEILLEAGEQMIFTNSAIDNIFITTTVEATVRIFMQN